jgi:hypothetical protein
VLILLMLLVVMFLILFLFLVLFLKKYSPFVCKMIFFYFR